MAVCKNIIYGPTAGDVNPDPATNVIIPGTGKPRLRIQAVYADDGTSIAYYECLLTIDTILYSATSTLLDVEEECNRIYKILMTKGLQLKIYPVGLGKTDTINTATVQDIKGGPYPQECVVEPFAGTDAILLHWSVMFRITFCVTGSIGQGILIQFNSELDIDVDDDGDVVINQRFTYQYSNPIVNIGGVVFNSYFNSLIRGANRSFQGMRRRKRTSFSRDQRTMHVHIEYREVKSDSAFFQNTRNVECTDEISSDLMTKSVMSGAGFMTWNRKLSATITLPARIHKSYAWYVFLVIVKQRLANLTQLLKIPAAVDAGLPAGQNLPDNTKNSYMLTSVRISNPIYTRQIKFDLGYFVVTDLENLLDKTKIFTRVNAAFANPPTNTAPLPLSDQWVIWDNANNTQLNGIHNYLFDAPIVYSQCAYGSGFSAITNPYKISSGSVLPMENDPDVPTVPAYEKPPEPTQASHTWLDYKNEFAIIENANNVQVTYLQEPPNTEYYKSQESKAYYTYRDQTGYRINGQTSPVPPTKPSATVTRSASTFQVRMRGFALRTKYKIPIPTIISVANKDVSRTGRCYTSHQQISRGVNPVYLAVWDITYNIDGDVHDLDIMNTIKSSGSPGSFV